MNALLWVIATFAAFGLGMASVLYFQKTRPPDRRKGDRRQQDRRVGDRRHWSAQSTSPPAAAAGDNRRTDRRQDDRRSTDRRKGKPAWQLATVIVSALFLLGVGTVGYAESRVASIFADSSPELIDSGWADCDTPITWSLDTSRLRASDVAIVERQITRDLKKWQEASGLDFRYVGDVPVIYDDTTFVVTSDQHPSPRHIYIALMNAEDSTLLDARTVGFAAPTKVWKDSREIVEGSVVLSVDFVKEADRTESSALYLHELGHALGLGHGEDDEDVMYYLVGDNNNLSPADIEGIRAIVKACKDRS